MIRTTMREIREEVKLVVPQRAYGSNRERTTSDDEIAKAAQGRLDASPYFALRSIKAEFHEGIVVLRGQVTTYYHKQMAQESIRSIAGIAEIINVVEVIQGTSVVTPENPARER